MTPLAGVIADDFSGATDIAGLFVRAGLRVRLWFDGPEDGVDAKDCDVVVLALKSRSVPADVAVASSLAALATLRLLGVSRFYFKYCSTFDSTARGNIGPVAEALLHAIGCEQVLFCPAFPENGRTVYRGHLFVGDRPLHESGMERHLLNPMTDSNLVRVLGSQSRGRVGSLSLPTIVEGPEAVRAALTELRNDGRPLVIADAILDAHLAILAEVLADEPLLTGGSALGFWLAREWQGRGLLARSEQPAAFFDSESPAAIVVGSCSAASRRQVADFTARNSDRVRNLDIARAAAGEPVVEELLCWARGRIGTQPLLVHSYGDGTETGTSRREHEVGANAAIVEETLASIAAGMVGLGVRRLVVAGGETSGAVVRALGVQGVRVGREIVPGVPWIATLDGRLSLALKSGNFGGDDFITRALEGES